MKKCPHCGKDVADSAPLGVCAECLLAAGLESRSGGATLTDEGKSPGRHPFAAPSPAELAAAFPQLEILELIGQGGMGAVYKARQPALDRFVALKILPADPSVGNAFYERFSREAKALAQLSHPGIVTVHDFGRAGGFLYFVMEFIDGANLRQLLRSHRLSPREALAIVPQICEALQYAHDHGVVHRDIKPENILVDSRGRVKIADFGLARLLGRPAAGLDRLTRSQEVMGTPQYMAPEQLERPLEVDHRADIYALGVVFYEMLTGELPLGRFQPPSSKVQVDVRLDEVVLRALEKEPARRYQHASDIKTGVETILTVPAAAASPAPSGSPTPARLSRLAVAGAAWAPFSLVAVFMLFFVRPVAVSSGAEPPSPSAWSLLAAWVFGLAGLSAPFGTTLLGCLAIGQIRRSAGRLWGLGLAVFDALLFPVLVLDSLLVWGLYRLLKGINQAVYGQFTAGVEPSLELVLLMSVPIVLAADSLLIRPVWHTEKRRAFPNAPTNPVAERTWRRQKVFWWFELFAGLLFAVGLTYYLAKQERGRLESRAREMAARQANPPVIPAAQYYTQNQELDLDADGTVRLRTTITARNESADPLRQIRFFNSDFIELSRIVDGQRRNVPFSTRRMGDTFRYEGSLPEAVPPGGWYRYTCEGIQRGMVKPSAEAGVFEYRFRHWPGMQLTTRRIEIHRLPPDAELLGREPNDLLVREGPDHRTELFIDRLIPEGDSLEVAYRYRLTGNQTIKAEKEDGK